ncbi:tripartite tricarboxylate transporter TctB family protein [Bosea sp. NPDC055332]
MPNAEKAQRQARQHKPWWLGLALAIMGALWLNGARGIASTTSYIGLGPAAIVLAVGLGLTILGIILILQALRGEFAAVDDEAEAPPSRAAFMLALAGVAIPLLTMRWLGFPLTAMLAFTLVTHGFGSRRTALDLAIGFVLGSAAWFGFSRLGISLGGFLPLIG